MSVAVHYNNTIASLDTGAVSFYDESYRETIPDPNQVTEIVI